mmetsp:Transcript_13052/g.28797  ORF Transcript_13052/g.28797 Transcript_13052/m.28797 type:complete len:225 (+) Transcript_13052:455-1129(+)
MGAPAAGKSGGSAPSRCTSSSTRWTGARGRFRPPSVSFPLSCFRRVDRPIRPRRRKIKRGPRNITRPRASRASRPPPLVLVPSPMPLVPVPSPMPQLELLPGPRPPMRRLPYPRSRHPPPQPASDPRTPPSHQSPSRPQRRQEDLPANPWTLPVSCRWSPRRLPSRPPSSASPPSRWATENPRRPRRRRPPLPFRRFRPIQCCPPNSSSDRWLQCLPPLCLPRQ